MADAFIGEIRAVGFDFAPRGWAMCNGQLLPISQNTALFSILGTTYGGDGRSTFALPDLQARIPLHSGNASPGPGLNAVLLGEPLGTATVNLTEQHLPPHTHAPRAVDAPGDTDSPAGANFAQAHTGRVTERIYATGGTAQAMAANALITEGGSQQHNNLPPYLVLNFVIALQGIYPPHS